MSRGLRKVCLGRRARSRGTNILATQKSFTTSLYVNSMDPAARKRPLVISQSKKKRVLPTPHRQSEDRGLFRKVKILWGVAVCCTCKLKIVIKTSGLDVSSRTWNTRR